MYRYYTTRGGGDSTADILFVATRAPNGTSVRVAAAHAVGVERQAAAVTGHVKRFKIDDHIVPFGVEATGALGPVRKRSSGALPATMTRPRTSAPRGTATTSAGSPSS